MSGDNHASSLLRRLTVRVAGGVAATIGCVALLGWVLEIPRLTSLGQGLIPMAPSTAVLFVVYGIAILFTHRAACNRRDIFIFRSVFACGAIISTVLLALNFRGVFLDAEHLGILTTGYLDGTPIGHMSPITAFTFLLFSLLFPLVPTSAPRSSWHAKTAWWISGMLVAAYTTLILAYLFGTPMFYGGALIPPSANTSLAFMALGIALSSLSQYAAWPEAGKGDQELRYSSRLLIMVFFFLVGGIISAGYFYHRNHEKHYLAEVEQQLSAIADLKIGELMLWREERMGDAGLFYNNSAFASLVKSYFRNPASEPARREIETWFGNIKENRNYDRVFLLDEQGKTRLSLPERSNEPLLSYVRQQAVEALHSGRITFADFYRNEFSGKIYLSILVPLFDPSRQGHPLGVLVMRIDPGKYLYPFIKRWPSASATAETLLVRREGTDVVFLNELKFRKDSALNLRFPLGRKELPAVMAALGRQGIVRGTDYRGKPVLAAQRSVPDSPWYLVSKVDIDEIYAPMRESQWITALLVSAMLLAAATGVGFVWRQQSASFYRDRYEAESERLKLEERLVKIASNVPGAIFQLQVSPDGSCFLPYASSGLEALYGIMPEDVVRDASPLFAMIHPADSTGVREAIFTSARTHSPWRNEHRAVHPHKGDIWVEGNATPEIKADGSVLFHGFITDITERKRAEEVLKDREEKLQEKNAELERFTYMISHDLKSPLVTLKTFLGYLEQDMANSDTGRIVKDLHYMHTAADRMKQMIDELLELSRVGRVANAPQACSLQELAAEALNMVAGLIAEHGVEVEVSNIDVALYGDRPRLLEIWQNLLENACKFMGNQAHPLIEIGVDGCDGETVFFVRDNGVGIEAQYQEKVFGLFERLDRNIEGTGLGLALVKRIVELNGGKIWVESQGSGQGTCFRFTLPGAVKGIINGDKC